MHSSEFVSVNRENLDNLKMHNPNAIIFLDRSDNGDAHFELRCVDTQQFEERVPYVKKHND
ncbi:hypothetical protein BRE01_48990 [Brevibacillus reuszeri]|uniref:Uncharacterized protein n=1 Tax=Brevibacillus reuszeri TaxID=54915 RepID=A0ABQ0TTD8_9BACL|nr:hypothetical protein BRE01_48990 [Brevibacillus reuszeri]